MTTRGGTRTGAGRKPLVGNHTVRRALLTDTHVETAKRIGGNMSAGIRAALDQHSVAVALFVSPNWGELMELFTTYGIDRHEMRCQKHDGVWHGQIYLAEPPRLRQET